MDVEQKHRKLQMLQGEMEQFQAQVGATFLENWYQDTFSARLDAHHWASGPFARAPTCSKAYMVALCGRTTSNENGVWKIRLDKRLCGAGTEGIDNVSTPVIIREPYFVATAHEATPCFVTSTTSGTPQAAGGGGTFIRGRDGLLHEGTFLIDVETEVRTWKHDGTKAAWTSFDWVCMLEIAHTVSIGG